MKTATLVLRVVALAIAAIGVWLLLQSPVLGERSATALLVAQGGMDTGKYLALVESSISAYRWLGAILVAVGLWRASERFATVV